MRWYCVLCLRASFLKNSTLRLLREIVTFTPSSRNTRSSGFGRKSGTTLTSPRGSSVYLIFSLIDSFSFAPISCAVDTDNFLAVSEPHREDAGTHPPEAVVPLFARAVGHILRDNALRVSEGNLRHREGHTVLFLVLLILVRIPFEPGLSLSEHVYLSSLWRGARHQAR